MAKDTRSHVLIVVEILQKALTLSIVLIYLLYKTDSII